MEVESGQNSKNSPEDTEQSTFFYLLKLLILNWKKLFILYFVVGTVTVISLYLVPEWYRSDATVVILEERGGGSMSAALSDVVPFNIGGFGAINTDRYLQFTRTKILQDRVIEKFNLKDVYEAEYAEDVYSAFNENFYIYDNDNNTFDIAYSYKNNPVKAAEITNFIFEVLHDVALEVDKAQASNFREYLERYLESQEQKLIDSRNKMIQYQAETGIINLPAQIEATIESMAALEVSRTEILLQLEYLKNTVSEDNIEFQNLRKRYDVYSNQIENLKSNQNTPLLSIEGLPERAAGFLELQRDIVIGEQVTEFVRVQYEEAMIEEQKISSNLYLLDPAQVPQKRFKPQRTRTLIIVMFFTALLSLVYIRAEDYYKEHEESFKELLN